MGKEKSIKDSVIILSGGMDSITLLYDKMNYIALAVTFDYGSNHAEREIAYAKYHCEQLGIKHIIIPLPFFYQYFESSLLAGADKIPIGSHNLNDMRSTVIPFRNGIMLSIAAGLAESMNLKKILIANHSGDHSIYPDCRADFIEAMDKAIFFGTYNKISIEAPYTLISKAEIASKGKILGINYSKTYSCYKGGDKHCGRCATCIERQEAMRIAGIKDTTEYEDNFNNENMYEVQKRIEISASHQLRLSYASKCENLHGHNWVITLYCKSRELNKDGMVTDFTHIKQAIHARLDHQNLNEVLEFNPTAENIARWCTEQIPQCYKASVQESEGNIAIYEDENK